MKLQAYENIGWRTSLISQDTDGSAAGGPGGALFHGSRLKLQAYETQTKDIFTAIQKSNFRHMKSLDEEPAQ